MTLLQAYLSNPRTRRALSKKPGQAGFSLIELVVVIAVLAVLTAIALPNFLGVSDDASARSGQQAAITAFKECQVKKARGEVTGTAAFEQADINDFSITAQPPGTSSIAATDTNSKLCFTGAGGALNSFAAVPAENYKFPKFIVKSSGDKKCTSGSSGNYSKSYNTGCDEAGAAGSAYGSLEGDWR